MASPLQLLALGARGNNVVNKPQDLDPSECVSSQNAEISTAGGEGGLDQRPGMTLLNATALSGAVAAIHDVPSDFLFDRTPVLYAGLYSGATHNWRRSTDGVTWTNDDTLAKPASSGPLSYYKNFPKCVTVGRYLYFVDALTPYNLHQWDGTTDKILSPIPPAVSGLTLSTPINYPANADGMNVGPEGSVGSTTYTYKFVAVNGASTSAASTGATITNGVASLSATGYVDITAAGAGIPVAGATSYNVYRTVGGATQGKIGAIPIASGAFTLGNGSGLRSDIPFTDAGLTGDSSAAPTGATGASSANALAVSDLLTDGVNLYFAVIDSNAGAGSAGRILLFNPVSETWLQLLGEFPITASKGAPGALANYDGAITYGTYLGATATGTGRITTAAYPLPQGGIPEVHDLAAGQAPDAIQGFGGAFFSAAACMTSGAAALITKRLPPTGAWSTSDTAPATGSLNAYTSLCQFNGLLFAGWTSGDGNTAAQIRSTPDGVTWTVDKTLATTEVPCQMVVFGSCLYVVLGKTAASYNTSTRILQRTTGGAWTEVDNPADDFAGCLGVVYI